MAQIHVDAKLLDRLPQLGDPAVQRELLDLCRRNCISSLSLFGSLLRRNPSRESDIDLLVEFDPSSQVGYLKLADVELQLTELLGRPVDLRTPAELSRYFRDQVRDSAYELYAA